MKKVLFLLLGLTIILMSYGQDTIRKAYVSTTNYEIPLKSIQKVKELKKEDYQGTYHYGDSESEYDVDVLVFNDKLYGMKSYSVLEEGAWKPAFERIELAYENNKLDEGLMYVCTEDSDNLKKGETGIVTEFFDKNEDGTVTHYYQFNQKKFDNFKFLGSYPYTQYIKITEDDLKEIPREELKFMRNEIYARHGYVFRKGGAMEAYFSKVDWYKKLEKLQEVYLSEIEKYNAEFILDYEKKL